MLLARLLDTKICQEINVCQDINRNKYQNTYFYVDRSKYFYVVKWFCIGLLTD